ncbi:MAG: peroxiredoxin [Bacteriovoracia bacterium]
MFYKFVGIFLMLCIGSFSSLASIEEGSPAPDFSAKNQDGKTVKLSDYKGSPVVLFFYPKDETPGCTKEACKFRDSYAQFKSHHAVVFGISKQSAESHKKFKAKYHLPFDLLVDSEGEIANKFGVNSMPVLGWYKRDTVVISANGVVQKIYRGVDPEKNASEILEILKAF